MAIVAAANRKLLWPSAWRSSKRHSERHYSRKVVNCDAAIGDICADLVTLFRGGDGLTLRCKSRITASSDSDSFLSEAAIARFGP